MMKKAIVIFLSVLSVNVYASSYQVYGKLKDQDSKQAVEFATIAVEGFESNKMITALISDSKGEFSFKIEPGKYTLTIRCMGYKQIMETIRVVDKDLFLKTIVMTAENKILDAVSVVASSYNEQYDRSIQVVTKQFKASSTNVSDLLSKIRGIDIDPLDNAVSVNNDKKVLILLNGLKKEQAYVKNLSPDRVSRIEITRNPTGQYISDGYTSVINIILKKNYSGYDLYFEEKGLYSLNKSNGDDRLFNNRAAFNFTYTIKKINVYGSYSNMKSNTNLFVENRKYMGNNSLIKQAVSDVPNLQKDGLSNTFLLGTDLFINARQSISLETNMIFSPLNQNHRIQSYRNRSDANGDCDFFISQLNLNHSDDEYYSLLSYRNSLSDNNKLEVNYGYNSIKSRLLNTYRESDEVGIKQTLHSKRNTSIVDLNFKHIFNKVYSFDAGYKNNCKTYRYNFSSLPHDEEAEKNSEIRNLLYAYLNITPERKVKTKIGLAAELSTLKANNQTDNYVSLQPYLSVYYKASDKVNMTLKLNSDSEYPYADQVSPFEITRDRLSSEAGNPDLNFATKYTASFNISIFKNKLSIEPFYAVTENFISETGQVADHRFQYTYSNLDRYQSGGLKVSTSLDILPEKMFFSLTASLYSDRTDFKGYTNRIADFNINSNLTYIAPKHKTLYAVLMKRMNAKKIRAYGYYSDDNDYLGCIIRQAFFKRKMAVTCLYLLPVSSGLNYSMDDSFEYLMFKEETKASVDVLKNMFMLRVSFKLNKGKDINTIKKQHYKHKKVSGGFF